MKQKLRMADLSVIVHPTGWIEVAAVVDGYRESRKYDIVGCRWREACRMFLDEFNK